MCMVEHNLVEEKAAELFDSNKFQQIRSKSILEFTIDYARVRL